MDEAYLSDSAELFDADMGDHGFLAIAPGGRTDTAVMLLDCEGMIKVWSLDDVQNGYKNPLIAKTAAIPGLRGVRVLVIDPRRSETARASHAEWIGIRPGTDGALALGAIHVLIEEDLYDHRFVEDWTHGFEDLRAYVRDFTPERVAEITQVPAATIRDLARSIATAKGCSFVMYTGLEYSNSDAQSVRAAWTLQAISRCPAASCSG